MNSRYANFRKCVKVFTYKSNPEVGFQKMKLSSDKQTTRLYSNIHGFGAICYYLINSESIVLLAYVDIPLKLNIIHI